MKLRLTAFATKDTEVTKNGKGASLVNGGGSDAKINRVYKNRQRLTKVSRCLKS